VRLRYSGGLRKVKEVLERLRLREREGGLAGARGGWPHRMMKGVELEPS